jgi:hypothetical protein
MIIDWNFFWFDVICQFEMNWMSVSVANWLFICFPHDIDIGREKNIVCKSKCRTMKTHQQLYGIEYLIALPLPLLPQLILFSMLNKNHFCVGALSSFYDHSITSCQWLTSSSFWNISSFYFFFTCSLAWVYVELLYKRWIKAFSKKKALTSWGLDHFSNWS